MQEKPLSISELADFLSVPVGTLYQWRSKGLGPPAIKVGRHLRWRPTDVDDWMTREATGQSHR